VADSNAFSGSFDSFESAVPSGDRGARVEARRDAGGALCADAALDRLYQPVRTMGRNQRLHCAQMKD
jgi:hypothetical protein